jgi:hypothetical protein
MPKLKTVHDVIELLKARPLSAEEAETLDCQLDGTHDENVIVLEALAEALPEYFKVYVDTRGRRLMSLRKPS